MKSKGCFGKIPFILKSNQFSKEKNKIQSKNITFLKRIEMNYLFIADEFENRKCVDCNKLSYCRPSIRATARSSLQF